MFAKVMKKGMAICLTLVMAMPVVMTSGEAKTVKKTAIDPFYDTVSLVVNTQVDGRYDYNAHTGLEGMIENKKEGATYSIKIKNTKVAKSVKNKGYTEGDDIKTLIYAVGTGSTTGDVYEQAKSGKKTKLGKITIKVKKEKTADAVYAAAFSRGSHIPSPVYLSPYMGMKTYDLAANIDECLNDSVRGINIKKSEYTVSYDINYYDGVDPSSDNVPVTIDSKGLVTAKKKGEATVDFNVKFKDKSVLSWNVGINVIESSIKTEGKYNLDNIRQYIVGIDTQVPINGSNGVSGSATQICFDNAATTPAFKPVEDEVHEKLLMYGSIGRGFSEKSNYSTELYNSTRDKILDFLGADHSKYTCFYTNSTTDGLNKLASALITSKKDVVLTTRIEHHANDLSWRERCKVIYAEVKKDGRVNYADMKKLLKKNKVKIVSVSAASNVTGYVQDIRKVAKLAHKYGAMVVADGAQIVAHRAFSMIGDPTDPSDDVDFIAFSAHKMYSPYGGGAVVGKAEELYKHMPTFYGGGTVKIVADNWVHYKDNDVAVYEAGSPNYPGVVGLGKAIDVISDVGFDAIEKHEKILNRKLIDGLKKLYPDVILYGDSENIDDRVGVVTFNFSDVNTQLLAEELSNIGAVATRRGQFCAHPYVWRLMGIPDSELESFEGCASAKTPGMIRVSFGIYNTEEEIDKFLEILPKAVESAKNKQEMYDAIPEY